MSPKKLSPAVFSPGKLCLIKCSKHKVKSKGNIHVSETGPRQYN